MSGQAAIFIQTICIGLCAGAVYDIFRLLRIYIAHSNAVIHIQDFLYWLFVAVSMFYIFLNHHYGEIRWFCFLGVAVGMALYFALLSVFIMRISKIIINLFLKIMQRICRILGIPVKLLYKLLEPFVNSLFIFLKKVLQNIKNYARIRILLFQRDISVLLKKL